MESISIIIPVYNAEKYLSSCLDSLLAQTYPHLQIILVNDGSTDASPHICDTYAKNTPIYRLSTKRIKVSAPHETRESQMQKACILPLLMQMTM